MKVNKQFTIDSEIVDELSKEKNASGLINSLLVNYFTSGGKLEKTEIMKRISEKETQTLKLIEETTQLKTKLESLEKKEKYIKEIFKDIPDEVMDDLKSFPKMSESVLRNRHHEIYAKKYNISYDKVLKAFKEFFKDRKET